MRYLNILNTIATVLISYLICGVCGIVISLIPDCMLIFIIKDLVKGRNKDRLKNIKLHIHLFLHSMTFTTIYFFVGIVMITLLNLNILDYYIKILLIFNIHIILDYLTHRKKDNVYFNGYYIFYPYKKLKVDL